MTGAPHAGWGEPPWRVDVEVPRREPPASVDVAIVGGGFTGLSAAYHAARAGASVALFEATRLGAGASGRTGGLVLAGTAAGPLPGTEDTVDDLARVAAEAAIACDLRLGGCSEIAHGAPEDARTVRPTLGWRDGGAALDVVGTVAGGAVDAGALVAGLAAAALRVGAILVEDAPVATVTGGTLPSVHLRDGRAVRCATAVVALNAYTPAVLPVAASFTPALTYALTTAPFDADTIAALGLADGRPFYTVDLPYLWGRTMRDGSIMFGSGLTFDGQRDLSRVAVAQADPAAALALLESRVRMLHPALRSVAITRRWGGPIAFTAARVPVLMRDPAAPAVIVTGGYAGHGVALGVRVGALVATAATSGGALPAWGAQPG